MVLHPQKTKSMTITTRQKRQRNDLRLSLYLDKTPIEQVSEHRVLGVTIDNEFRWHKHIDNVCKKVSRNLFLLFKLKHYVDSNARKLFFDAHVMSHINYASVIWRGASENCTKKLNSLHRRAIKLVSCPLYLINKLQKVQNSAARLVLKARKTDHVTPLLHALHWLPIQSRINYKLSTLCFNFFLGSSPSYFSELLTVYTPTRQLRSSTDDRILSVPRIKTKTYGQRTFTYSASTQWNSLPHNIRHMQSPQQFKRALKTHLFRTPFG